jgi:hypothetical protein
MRLRREQLLSLWELEDMPACEAGMKFIEGFLTTCGEAVDRFGEEEPADRLTQIEAAYMEMVEHADTCADCKEE